MQQMVNKFLETYGTTVTLRQKDDSSVFRAFFQPVLSKSWQYLEGNYSPLGEIPRGQYIYIGPAEPEAQAGDTLIAAKKEYLLRRTELIRQGNTPLYCWGLCVEKGGTDKWGQF